MAASAANANATIKIRLAIIRLPLHQPPHGAAPASRLQAGAGKIFCIKFYRITFQINNVFQTNKTIAYAGCFLFSFTGKQIIVFLASGGRNNQHLRPADKLSGGLPAHPHPPQGNAAAQCGVSVFWGVDWGLPIFVGQSISNEAGDAGPAPAQFLGGGGGGLGRALGLGGRLFGNIGGGNDVLAGHWSSLRRRISRWAERRSPTHECDYRGQRWRN
jgi:hypothetical protein